MFVTCSGEWDEDTQSWNPSDVTDMAKCCTKQCLDPVNFCYSFCEDRRNAKSTSPILNYRCKQMCEDQRTMCLDTCSLISKYVSKDNNYIKCANSSGCEFKDDVLDVECLLNNKEDIFKCCRKNTPTNSDVDGDKNCEYLQSVYLNPYPVLTPLDKNIRLSSLSETSESRFGSLAKSDSDNSSFDLPIYVYWILVIIIFLLSIIFLIMRKRN